MCAATRNRRDCLFLLALLAALVQPISCSSVLDDNPLQPDVEAPLWTEIDARHASPMHEQDGLYEKRLLRGTGNIFTARSSNSCQEECKGQSSTLRCVKLCTCMRQKRCNEERTRSKRRRCKNLCIKEVNASVNKRYETISDFDCFRTVKGTNDTMIRLANDFPDLVTIMDIGYSYRVQDPTSGETGYTIRLVKITSTTIPQGISEKAKVFVVAGVHAREYAPPEIVLRFAEKLAEGYGKDADITWILGHTEIYILPIANPDGRQIAETNRQLSWRKNRHFSGCGKSAKDGVDINRNFPFKYGEASSSSNPCSEEFRGNKELSEVESQAIFDFAETMFPDRQKVRGGTVAEAEENVDMACGVDVTGVYLDLHSYGGLISYPWGWAKNKKSPDDIELQTMARKLASFGEYGLWGPGQPDFLYAVGGDTTDTMYALHCVASFTFEVGSAFYQKCNEFDANVFPTNYEALIYAAKVASAPFKIPKGPDVLSLEVESTTSNSVTVTVLVSDEERSIAYGKAFADTGRQAIAMVRVFVDEHPYTTQNTGKSMTPSDTGGFNMPTEAAFLEIKSLSPGRHLLYIEAEDSAGFKGPISAAFFDV